MILRIVDFIRARPAMLVAAVLILIFVLGLAGALKPRRHAAGRVLYTNAPAGTNTTLTREIVPVTPAASKPSPPPQPKPSPPPRPIPAPAPEPKPLPPPEPKAPVAPAPVPPPTPPPPPVVQSNPPLALLRLHAEVPRDTSPPPLGVYAPAGRLIRCQLVNTVDSANIDTPIIALVTDDLWHDGKLVIPTGSEVHGKASVDRMRERIVASGAWTIVLQTGEELVVQGVALDRDENPTGGVWGLTDGSAGLKGQILKSDSMAEVKMFVATFLSGVASGLQETRDTAFGTRTARTAQNAALAGASQVLNTYAEQILETIQREGLFVRVPAGKQMYLYVNHTLDRSQGKIGNLRLLLPPSPPSRTPTSSAER